MPTVFTHPAPVLALGAILGGRLLPPRMLLFGVICAVLPDADVIGFRFGIRYADLLGHRGFSHSLLFAVIMGLVGALLAPRLRGGRVMGFGVGLFAVASHILLDAMTNSGLGVAAFWPFDPARHFCAWRPIRVSPFGLRALLSERGLAVFASELRWVWLPCAGAGLSLWLARRLWPACAPGCSGLNGKTAQGGGGAMRRCDVSEGRPRFPRA